MAGPLTPEDTAERLVDMFSGPWEQPSADGPLLGEDLRDLLDMIEKDGDDEE